MPDVVRRNDVVWRGTSGQYSFQINVDNALLRLVYEFDSRGRTLRSASLGYYCSKPTVAADELEDAQYSAYADAAAGSVGSAEELGTSGLIAMDSSDSTEEQIAALESEAQSEDIAPVSWLRIDYAPDQERGPLHAPCHAHFSGFIDARMMVNGVPSPRQFIDFILALAYPELFQRRLGASGNIEDEPRFRNLHETVPKCAHSDSLPLMTHLRFPGHPL